MERLTKHGSNYCEKAGCYSNTPCDCLDKRTYNKLMEYEDAEEQGLLIKLPCKVGSHVWRVWITDRRKPKITEHDMPDLLHIVQWIDKFGKTVFLSREEAEAALAKGTNVSSKGANNG